MKKLAVLCLTVFIVFGATGCEPSRPLPEDQVAQFFDALKTKDETVLAEYMNYDEINVLLNSKGDKTELDQMYQALFQNFSYKTLSATREGDTASVTVEITNTNFTKVLQSYEKKAYSYTIDNLYSKKVNKKNLNATCLKIFVTQIKKAAKKQKLRTKTVTVTLEANDFADWTIILDEEQMDAIMGGLKIPFREI